MQKEESLGSVEISKDMHSGMPRQSNIELLRIFAMFFIVMHHYVMHGTTSFVYLDSPLTLQNVFALFLASLGRPAVGIFVLICGYFSIKSDFKLPRFVTLIAQVFSYSVVLLLLAKFVLPVGASIGRAEILSSVFPTAYGTYWFMTSYAVLILLSPYINKLLLLLTQKQHKALILLFVAIWCISPTILGANFAGSDLAYFVAFYSIAAYFRLYPSKANPSRYFALFGFWALVVLASIASASFLLNYSGVFRKYITYFSEYNRLPGAMCAIELFLALSQSKPFYSKWINGIASTSFGIYLIHENPFIRPLLWGKLFDSSAYVNTPLYFVHLLVSVIIVFAGCAVIDTLFWKLSVGTLFCMLRDKYLDKFVAFVKSLYFAIEKFFVKLI
ncbi:MAG TPA: acyltransferase [Clostridia bacterium]|nr:acyltransferase [Clostridia bacterium]